MVGFSVLMAIGLMVIPTGRSVVLAYTTPLWVTPGASLFLHERLTPRRAAGVVMGLLGLVVLFNPLAFDWSNRTAVLGNGALVLAALLWAASIVHIRGHHWRGTPFQLLPWETLLAAADRHARGPRRARPARGALGCGAGPDAALRRRARDGARVLGRGGGQSPIARGHDLARAPGRADHQHRHGHPRPGRGADPVASGRGGARDRGRRGRHDRRRAREGRPRHTMYGEAPARDAVTGSSGPLRVGSRGHPTSGDSSRGLAQSPSPIAARDRARARTAEPVHRMAPGRPRRHATAAPTSRDGRA